MDKYLFGLELYKRKRCNKCNLDKMNDIDNNLVNINISKNKFKPNIKITYDEEYIDKMILMCLP